MGAYLTPILQLQRFIVPGLILLLAWSIWRVVFRKDIAVGLVLYLALVIMVDGFFNTGIFLPGLEKGSIRYSEVCVFFLLINRPAVAPDRLASRAVPALVGLYFVLLFVSTLRSDPVMAGIFEFRRLIVPQMLALLVAKRGLVSLNDYRRFFVCLTTLAIIVGMFTFWDLFFDRWILKSDMLYKPEYWMNRKHGRYGSLFLNPNLMGAFVVLVFPAVFVWTLNEQRFWHRTLGWIGLLALVFGLVETQSRGPLLAFGIALLMLVMGPCGNVSRRRRVGFLLLFVMVFSLGMPGFIETAIQRFDTLDEESSLEKRSRQSVWEFTERIIADHPFGGIGFGEQQYLRAMAAYGFNEQFEEGSLDNPHNSYLQAAVYAGIPALLAFIIANVGLLARSAREMWRDGSNENIPIVFGFAVGIFGFLACIYPDMHLFTQNVAPIYWLFFGLLLSLAARPGEANAK